MTPVRHSRRYPSTKFENLRHILGSCGSHRICEWKGPSEQGGQLFASVHRSMGTLGSGLLPINVVFGKSWPAVLLVGWLLPTGVWLQCGTLEEVL